MPNYSPCCSSPTPLFQTPKNQNQNQKTNDQNQKMSDKLQMSLHVFQAQKQNQNVRRQLDLATRPKLPKTNQNQNQRPNHKMSGDKQSLLSVFARPVWPDQQWLTGNTSGPPVAPPRGDRISGAAGTLIASIVLRGASARRPGQGQAGGPSQGSSRGRRTQCRHRQHARGWRVLGRDTGRHRLQPRHHREDCETRKGSCLSVCALLSWAARPPWSGSHDAEPRSRRCHSGFDYYGLACLRPAT